MAVRGRPIKLDTDATWDQRLRFDWELAKNDSTDILFSILEKLSDNRRDILMMRYGITDTGDTVAPMTITAIGRVMGTSKQNVDKRINKTRAQVGLMLTFLRMGGKL